MADATLELRERRCQPSSDPGALTVDCRIRYKRPILSAGRIKVHEGRAFHLCPECGGVSRIRISDAVLIGAPPDYLEAQHDND